MMRTPSAASSRGRFSGRKNPDDPGPGGNGQQARLVQAIDELNGRRLVRG